MQLNKFRYWKASHIIKIYFNDQRIGCNIWIITAGDRVIVIVKNAKMSWIPNSLKANRASSINTLKSDLNETSETIITQPNPKEIRDTSSFPFYVLCILNLTYDCSNLRSQKTKNVLPCVYISGSNLGKTGLRKYRNREFAFL